jgi:hypothetical protein
MTVSQVLDQCSFSEKPGFSVREEGTYMAEEWVEIGCVRCGHRWREELSRLDEEGPAVYRGAGEERDYQRRCPRCGTVNVITIAFDEPAGGEGQDDG